MVCYPTEPYHKTISLVIFRGKTYFGNDDFVNFWLSEKWLKAAWQKIQGDHNHSIIIVSDGSNSVGHKSYVQKWNPKVKE